MRAHARGFTLIELMIVVAIIGMLAVIAVPQYREYLQRSANMACLAEAEAYVGKAVADAADSRTPATFGGRACASGATMALSDFANSTLLSYTPQLRSSVSSQKNTECNAGTGNCILLP